MKLVDFSVTNYRSITKAHKISLNDLTVLVGKNNEGKTNLLTALDVAMTSMIKHGQFRRTVNRSDDNYEWNRDFPIQYQNRKNGLESIFRLNFCLEGEESYEFKRETGIRSDEKVPIEIKIGKDNQVRIAVPKRGSSSYTQKSAQVTKFICERISFNYIRAVRTDDMALAVLQEIILSEFRDIEKKKEYIDALKVIEDLEKTVYDSISNRILTPMQEFLPLLKGIKIENRFDQRQRYRMRSNIDIVLDDGFPTSIGFKGDGVKSLVSLSILKDIKNAEGASIIAIEEPESHLHSSAIHSLVDVINSITEKHQVIITTHNPLFVQRNSIKNNIIVNAGTAQPAKSIKEIRDILGVLPADNLINASHVLVVEGESDKKILGKILRAQSPKLKAALSKNLLVIKSLAGANNLNYELVNLRATMCKYFVFLDDDKSGRSSAEKAIESGYLNDAEIKYSICNGQSESEIEDCIKPDVYINMIQDSFSVDLKRKEFKCNSKWSERMKNVFLSQGQRWNDTIEKKVKQIVADSFPDTVENALIEQKRGSIDALINSLELLLD